MPLLTDEKPDRGQGETPGRGTAGRDLLCDLGKFGATHAVGRWPSSSATCVTVGEVRWFLLSQLGARRLLYELTEIMCVKTP